MATATIPTTAPLLQRPAHRATRKDVLGLYATEEEPHHSTLMTALQALAKEGIRVIPAGHGHWVLRGQSPLPEIHCYSAQELRRIAASPARHLLQTAHKDTP
ncbi:hypothetical protein ABIE59_000620 [Marinobacter sp. MBR-99]|jgi:hypothetical protein|uniref:hypothetical protein n=1 Tax=Marinobacter sp. MBR-99 TaxID=3156461 RepID=UPI00339B338E